MRHVPGRWELTASTYRVATDTDAGQTEQMSEMPSEDPRVAKDPDDDQKHKETDPNLDSAPDDPDAPAPFTGPYA